MHVVGTAGHVDHGKSSLVRALTGTDPDRWVEEKLRGMTLDLGFAHLQLADGVEAGIVDVPGHERFVHNMLAGAAGMELVLLVIAADEGPRPQTFEHLAILRHLNVRATIVALTKSDLLDDEGLVAAVDRTRDALAQTMARDAQIVPTSTVTGNGLDALRAALHEALRALPLPPADAPLYLPVDRAFTLAGHGTVVTGTLAQGRVANGDRLHLWPPGRDVRVRGVQVFGSARQSVDAGSRVALNLAGVERSEVARGAVLAAAPFVASSSAQVTFEPEADALGLLRRRTPVRAHVGAGETLGTLVIEKPLVDATRVSATLHLREPIVVVPHAPFVLRAMSPKTLLGGGRFQSIADGAHSEGSETRDDRAEAVLAALAHAGLGGADAARVGAAANLREDAALALLEALVEDGRAVRLHKPAAFADASLVAAFVERVLAVLAANETEAPWRMGMTSLALARDLEEPEPALVRTLAAGIEEGRVAFRRGYYATPAFVPELTSEQRAFFEAAFARDAAQPFLPVPFDDLLARIRAAKIAGLSAAYETLSATGTLHRVHDAVYRDDQISELRARLVAALREHKSITPAAFRDVVGTSRKYVVPLLEWFDATGVTLRSGDARVLRIQRSSGAPGG